MKYDEVLVRHAALAERYVFDDPNSALIKLRQFGELLAQHAAAFTGVAVEAHEPQRELLDKLWERQIINAQVSQLFHGLRKAGNEAAHQHTGDRREALHQLQMARKLAVWFHKSFGGDPHFKTGPFIPPPDPHEAERELRTELARLCEALVTAQVQMAGTQQLVEEQARQRQTTEAAAKRAYDNLTAALELAAETEQQLEQERQQFQEHLAELQAQVAATPIAQRQAEALDLNEATASRGWLGSGHPGADIRRRHPTDQRAQPGDCRMANRPWTGKLRAVRWPDPGGRYGSQTQATRRSWLHRKVITENFNRTVCQTFGRHPARHRRRDVADGGVSGKKRSVEYGECEEKLNDHHLRCHSENDGMMPVKTLDTSVIRVYSALQCLYLATEWYKRGG